MKQYTELPIAHFLIGICDYFTSDWDLPLSKCVLRLHYLFNIPGLQEVLGSLGA